jgi:hypothetical protein
MQKNCAVLLGRIIQILISEGNSLIECESIKHFFLGTLLDWSIPYGVKKILSRAFSSALDNW